VRYTKLSFKLSFRAHLFRATYNLTLLFTFTLYKTVERSDSEINENTQMQN